MDEIFYNDFTIEELKGFLQKEEQHVMIYGAMGNIALQGYHLKEVRKIKAIIKNKEYIQALKEQD